MLDATVLRVVPPSLHSVSLGHDCAIFPILAGLPAFPDVAQRISPGTLRLLLVIESDGPASRA